MQKVRGNFVFSWSGAGGSLSIMPAAARSCSTILNRKPQTSPTITGLKADCLHSGCFCRWAPYDNLIACTSLPQHSHSAGKIENDSGANSTVCGRPEAIRTNAHNLVTFTRGQMLCVAHAVACHSRGAARFSPSTLFGVNVHNFSFGDNENELETTMI